MPELYQELINLAESDMYPLHMPGHKRNELSTPMKGAFRCDITEIDGYDNLHDESGIILEAEERANKLYGADKTFFLVNGSTSGVLSAVSAAVSKNGTILAARGSHKSFYHAAYLRNLNVKYLPYKQIEGLNIPDCVSADDIEQNIEDDVEAVFITSPTYEGICSDIKKIAEICHKRGIPLIVDAAHGAHFGFGEKLIKKSDYSKVSSIDIQDNKSIESSAIDAVNKLYKEPSIIEYVSVPENAVSQGADIVIHSVHKTLPSMTQTALIHISGNLIDRARLKRFLRIYQSSSPSYVLMSSIDLCIKEMEENGNSYIEKLLKYRNRIQRETSDCKVLKVIGKNVIDDPSKVIVSVQDSTMTGEQLYDILREEYGLQLEMAGENTVLAIITGWDKEEGISRFINALTEIDKGLSVVENTQVSPKISFLPPKKMNICDAWDAESEYVPFIDAESRIAAEFVNLYPPGIPIIVPGEVYTKEIIDNVKSYINQGLNVQGIEKKEGFLCVRQK
ncbi:Arginine/lysine/ornithine decarboxylase [Butyrivibrio proteoclasticus]|uniref:Arginine/lysine/ornithine decarboxylase n=1 Tax=Butyrivibrio proteoclasticus TaxID=43305 RepID=A0A1I5VBZ4_9FIRM|nr:aminotransferase class I/II-fold pyridoxal phosphate-dependent enzyme [Butyrivibrio proteoclasticus]SFQ05033.1 Arginine/lysine/ornithine decarboxylase [Butyrivibrio proteoclasticus]